MAKNVEIKARIEADQFETLRRLSSEIATDGPIKLVQTDTFFQSLNGRLKLREFGDGSAEIIYYERPDCKGPKTSSYIRSSCPSPATLKEALAGSNGVLGVVKKDREVYFVNQTRVHLDRVDGLGTFLELEVVLEEGESAELGEAIAQEIMNQLDVDQSQLVSGAYFDLLANQHA
jgi:predicted adenylyl cyclase CyaB